MSMRSTQTPLAVTRGMREIGGQIATWRKLRGFTMAQVAERAGISAPTLRSIESGSGSPSMESVLRVSRALGVLNLIVQAMDPYATDVGRMRSHEVLPQRVRPPTKLDGDS